jgi:uncharacterized protein (UPF0216 family)
MKPTIKTMQQQVNNLGSQKVAMNETIERLKRHIESQPKVINELLAQKIVDVRDDVEYFKRRLEEAQILLNKLLNENKLQNLTLQVVVPPEKKQ